MDELSRWKRYADCYEKEVFSLTKNPKRCKQIIERIDDGKVLNIGTGPTDYLNKHMFKLGNKVYGSDFCQEMLDVVKNTFPNIPYVRADSMSLPFRERTFNSVVSSNSIVPPERWMVSRMFKEAHRVLKPGGKFVAFLPSYDCC